MPLNIKATREGLVGSTTASGYIIDTIFPFVALPSVNALHKWVYLFNPSNGKSCCAQVLDVGPWNEHDDSYVFGGQRPAVELSKVDTRGRVTNGAGIDLGEAVWNLLGMKDNTPIHWKFVQ